MVVIWKCFSVLGRALVFVGVFVLFFFIALCWVISSKVGLRSLTNLASHWGLWLELFVLAFLRFFLLVVLCFLDFHLWLRHRMILDIGLQLFFWLISNGYFPYVWGLKFLFPPQFFTYFGICWMVTFPVCTFDAVVAFICGMAWIFLTTFAKCCLTSAQFLMMAIFLTSITPQWVRDV